MRQARLFSPPSFATRTKLASAFRIAAGGVIVACICFVAINAYSGTLQFPQPMLLLPLGRHWLLPILSAGLFFLALVGVAYATQARRYPSVQFEGLPRKFEKMRFAHAEAIAHFGTYEIHFEAMMACEKIHWSDEMYRILGRHPEQGPLSTQKYIDTCVVPEDREHLRSLMRHALNAGKSVAAEYRILCKNGKTRHVYDYLECVSGDKEQRLFLGQLHDITERKLIEAERLESAARYQCFVEQLGGTPYIGSLDQPGCTIYIGNRIAALLGFSPEEWCGDPDLRIRQLHKDDRHAVLKAIEVHVATHNPLSIDYRIHRRDGTLRWFHDEARVITDASGKPLFQQGVLFDITERRQAQEELERSHGELKKLIGALDATREEEQKRLAREMHDDLGQLLAAMKMDLCDLQQCLPPDDSRALERLEGIQNLVTNMVTSVRRIIADLPPKMLEDLGLFNALAFMAANFEKRHQITCSLQLPEVEVMADARTATAIYRMVQEALNNVARHAGATRVDVRFDVSDDCMIVSVVDDGMGMASDAPRKAGSFGLIGIRERVTALRGKLKIESMPGEGTTVRIIVPNDVLRAAEKAS